MKRRALVLTHESASHWFRRSLPPHVFRVPAWAESDGRAAANMAAATAWRASGSDWRSFLSTYCSCFVAIGVFIA
ncbi:hypothetical protein [Novosphingobium panipatense]|nr:hypothetical protein [Novosphingobium panipatense]